MVYRTVVVPLDGSAQAEAALPVASALARRAMATVDLVSVGAQGAAGHVDEGYLRGLAPTLTAPLGTVAMLAPGDTAAAILDHARARPDAVICMTSHARSGVGEALLGSVAEAVVRQSELPVLLVGPSVRRDPVPTFDVMLVALDGTDLSERILPVARAWHETIGTKPWLLQVLDPSLVAVTSRSHGDLQETSYLRRVTSGLEKAGVPADYDVAHDRDPAWAIARFAEELPASVIALATHGRAGLSRLVLGSVAIGVVHRAHCPVLVVRGDHV